MVLCSARLSLGRRCIAPLLNAVTYLLGVLLNYAARKTDSDRLTVINTLRESIDNSYRAEEDPPTT